MKKNTLFICALMILSSCSPNREITMLNGTQQGAYSLKSFKIDPANDKIANDPEFQIIKPRLTELLKNRLGSLPQNGKKVGALIKINDVSTEINVARSLLVTDGYRIGSKVTIIDMATRQPISEPKRINVQTATNSYGLIGAIASEGVINHEMELDNLINNYISELTRTLYAKDSK